MKFSSAFACAVAIALAATMGPAAAFPEKPIRWIVPYNPGGGTDSTARILARAIEENKLLPQPLALVNIGGAGGSIAARQAKDAPPDGYTILIHQSALLIQDANKMSDFGFRNFELISSIGDQCMVAAVTENSPHKTYKSLIEAAKAKPRSVVWGGNIGSANHMGVTVMEHATPGADFKKVQIGGAAESYAAMKGNITEVGIFGVGEILAFRSGDVRPLAILAAQRDPAIPDVPTARELGYDAVFCNEHDLYAPKGTPPDRMAVLTTAFTKAMQTEFVKKEFKEKLGMVIEIKTGKALADHLAKELERFRPLAESMNKK